MGSAATPVRPAPSRLAWPNSAILRVLPFTYCSSYGSGQFILSVGGRPCLTQSKRACFAVPGLQGKARVLTGLATKPPQFQQNNSPLTGVVRCVVCIFPRPYVRACAAPLGGGRGRHTLPTEEVGGPGHCHTDTNHCASCILCRSGTALVRVSPPTACPAGRSAIPRVAPLKPA